MTVAAAMALAGCGDGAGSGSSSSALAVGASNTSGGSSDDVAAGPSSSVATSSGTSLAKSLSAASSGGEAAGASGLAGGTLKGGSPAKVASSKKAGSSKTGDGSGGSPPPPQPGYQAARPFSNSADCKFCHPRQFNEWRTSPHAYTGISPTFYSLVSAGQNSFGAGVAIDANNGVSQAGIVGNFCLPCHAPIGFIGLEGRYGNNNGGFADVQPIQAFVCAPSAPQNALQPCTAQTSTTVCGAPGLCSQFEGRTCVNMPPANSNTEFPRIQVHCTSDADCAAGQNGCPSGGDDCGPCVIGPATIFYTPEAQDGINCETCHNVLPNHQRSCQIYRNSDSTATLSFNIEEMETAGGRRLRLGPYPVEVDPNFPAVPGQVPPDGIDYLGEDTIPPVLNAFHESARVETPLVVPYQSTDRPGGVPNPANNDVQIVRPTALTCDELPYCAGGRCQGGPLAGTPAGEGCANDGDCGGCFQGTCGLAGPRPGSACNNSIDCGDPTNASQDVITRGLADGTLDPLISSDLSAPHQIDRTDGNYYRSSMMCAGCHDVRPPFVNEVLRSCQLAGTQVCQTDVDCTSLNIGCPGNDCGPCVAENAEDPSRPGAIGNGTGVQVGDERNLGFRRVENLFSEWQLSVYNHPNTTFCQGNSFRVCTSDADCQVNGFDDGPCNVASPYGEIVTCQDCHMSNFPETPLIDASGQVTAKNDLYSQNVAALDGSQSDASTPLPQRRVSTHFMAGVDLPLVRFPGQNEQIRRRQELIDAGFKIDLDATPSRATAGQEFDVEVTVENVGVGHRFPAGFSHERQNWLQVFVQEKEKLDALEILDDPFNENAPCHLQRTIATGAEDSRDPVGAAALELAGCIYRSGFLLDKAHPETGEMTPDGSFDDEDPEDFFVVTGTRMRGNPPMPGNPGDPRIEVNPGAEGRALDISNICAEATEETYRAAIAAGSGIDMGTTPGFPFQARFCDPALSPAQGPGHTSPGFGNPMCMEGDADVGPCVPEIELSDGNERGRCANDLARPSCHADSDCGPAGPCLFRCAGFPELECCEDTLGSDCAAFYDQIGTNADPDTGLRSCVLDSLYCAGGANTGNPCALQSDCPGGLCEETAICIGGPRSGLACSADAQCPGSNNCGDVGTCNVENRGIVNFQNQFRQTANGVCVDPANPREANGEPIPLAGSPACFLNANCILSGQTTTSGRPPVCLVNGQCNDGSGNVCTNITYQDDCGAGVSCDIEFNLELNARPSESVFIQNHPFNFNSMAPFQPRIFFYAFEVPPELAGKDLVVSVRLFNRHFPMRFLRNLIGTQVVRPPLIIEDQGNADDPSQCNDPRRIDIDCFVAPVITNGNAQPGGYIDPNAGVVMREIPVDGLP